MIRILLFAVIAVTAIACNSKQSIPETDLNPRSESIESKVKTPSMIKVSPEVRLSNKQTKELDKSLPSDVRNLLENAEEFEILAEMVTKDGKLIYPITEGFDFKPNLKADISDPNLRKVVLENFYYDVSKGSEPANCWQPHHILRAKQGGKIVEMEICFSCSQFRGKGSFGEFSGTTGRGDEKTENLFNNIIKNYGVNIQ